MTPELTALTAAALLQVIQFALMSITANLDVGTGKTMSPRDPGRLGGAVNELLSEKPGRLYRAFNNHFEGLIMFTIAVVVVALGEQSSNPSASVIDFSNALSRASARVIPAPTPSVTREQ